MKITGIICEYNPLHLGHKKQLDSIRQDDPDGGIVCLMSGNFVQRGMPAILNKMRRAEAAVRCGSDLVLELPVTYALSSAERFTAGGVAILSGFCDRLCFGAETNDVSLLEAAAQALLSPQFPDKLHAFLDNGLSFPAARQAALDAMGLDGQILTQPNNILAVEYCKAILAQSSNMKPLVIHREGGYHDTHIDLQNPSATAVRRELLSGGSWQSLVPQKALACFDGAVLHTRDAGERAILGRLRSMTDEEFAALPFGSEGLWRKLMHAVRSYGSLEQILTATKSKRYTRTRLDRMVLCAFLGITETCLYAPVPYVRVLAFNDRGRQILKKARQTGIFPNVGERMTAPYQALEDRCGDLYGLFANTAEPPGVEQNYRVYYQKSGEI